MPMGLEDTSKHKGAVLADGGGYLGSVVRWNGIGGRKSLGPKPLKRLYAVRTPASLGLVRALGILIPLLPVGVLFADEGTPVGFVGVVACGEAEQLAEGGAFAG